MSGLPESGVVVIVLAAARLSACCLSRLTLKQPPAMGSVVAGAAARPPACCWSRSTLNSSPTMGSSASAKALIGGAALIVASEDQVSRNSETKLGHHFRTTWYWFPSAQLRTRWL